MMKKNQDKEGKQQSTKTATRNNMSNNPPIHTHTHTHIHIHTYMKQQHRASQGRHVYKHQQQPEQESKQGRTSR